MGRDRISRVLEYATEKGCYIEWADEYAEPGYGPAEKGIAFANWNPELEHRVGDVLEKLGVECEWSDEWATCGNCGKAVRTSPDCYFWKPYYWLCEGELTCGECILKDPEGIGYLEHLENNPYSADTLGVDWSKYGYILLDEKWENGLHPGMNDKPEEVMAKLLKYHDSAIFTLETSQFYVTFRAWVKENSEEE